MNKALNEKGDAYEPFNEFPVEGLPNDHPFLALKVLGSKSSGLIQTTRGPMIIAARSITKSSLEGPIRGVLAIGRYLDKKLIDNIKKRSQLDIDVWSLSEKSSQKIPAGTPKNIKLGEIKTIIAENEKTSFVYSSYPDIYEKPLLLMRVSMPRDIVAQGKATIKYGVGIALASGLVIMLVLLVILQRSIISPLSSLTKNIVLLGKRKNVSQQLPLNRGDELGVVARSIFTSNEERNKAENILLYQNHILDSIAKKTDLKSTLDKMIGLMERVLSESKASILLLDTEGTKLNHLSAPSLPTPYIEAINGVGIGPEVGACGTAAYHNKMVISEDIANDPFWVDF